MANGVQADGNGYAKDKRAIDLRFAHIESHLEGHDAQHKHHFTAEAGMLAMLNKIKGVWMGIAVIASLLASSVAVWATVTRGGG